MIANPNQMTTRHGSGIYWLRQLFRLLSFLLLLPALFYFSLAFKCYLQRKYADNFERQYIGFKGFNSDQYIYEKDIYFTPEIATFQDSGGRIYLYIKDSVLSKQAIQNIRLDVIRKNHGETKRYRYGYSDSEKSVEKFQRSGYLCLTFPPVKLHIDYNNVTFAISGIDLPVPESDAEIMLIFSGIKRRVIFWTYLFKGVFSLAGWLLIISIYTLISKKIRHNRPIECRKSEGRQLTM